LNPEAFSDEKASGFFISSFYKPEQISSLMCRNAPIQPIIFPENNLMEPTNASDA